MSLFDKLADAVADRIVESFTGDKPEAKPITDEEKAAALEGVVFERGADGTVTAKLADKGAESGTSKPEGDPKGAEQGDTGAESGSPKPEGGDQEMSALLKLVSGAESTGTKPDGKPTINADTIAEMTPRQRQEHREAIYEYLATTEGKEAVNG